MEALLRKEMEQIKEEKDNEVKIVTEKYEAIVRKLKVEVNDGNLQIQNFMAEKVNGYFI